MTKKAGIITWCDNNGPTNYGQILQCYAMQNIFRKLGFDPLIIQYRKKTELDFYRGKFRKHFLNEIYEALFNIFAIEKTFNKRIFLFKKFIKENIVLSTPCYDKEDVETVSKSCVVLVCGSDQIWNPVWFDPMYGLDFGSQNQKRIAYAPSGVAMEDDVSIQKYIEMVKHINHIDFVSVRESKSVEILKKYTDKALVAVLDPIFLLEKEEWDKIASKRLIDEPYIFCYVMGSIRSYKLVLKAIKQKYNAKKIVLIPSNLIESKLNSALSFTKAGPAEFVSLIKYAEAVCTDSFHGTAMSIKYEKQFYTLKRAHKGTESVTNYLRIDNILNKMCINERCVNSAKEVKGIEKINYECIYKYAKVEIKKSENFIKNALQ